MATALALASFIEARNPSQKSPIRRTPRRASVLFAPAAAALFHAWRP